MERTIDTDLLRTASLALREKGGREPLDRDERMVLDLMRHVLDYGTKGILVDALESAAREVIASSMGLETPEQRASALTARELANHLSRIADGAIDYTVNERRAYLIEAAKRLYNAG